MRILKNAVSTIVVTAATAGIVLSTGAVAQADDGPTPSNWHCC
jgi:hypothetical protein